MDVYAVNKNIKLLYFVRKTFIVIYRIVIGEKQLAGRRGFEPPACSLGGCCHIQTRPPARLLVWG